ncbi:adult-specific rigid cuticular protein 15.5-like [Uloborus diversus]|uniref:adult-specific rigid cuticular protein 15.5-like n=1 Tax=Uloborus diversus TaxID=327109 RepID=UPI00240A5D2A|nr:adult-specific rigid cuticular protein 15.5-like [Uloborus diversus]
MIAKVLLLCASIAAVHATAILYGHHPILLNTGVSTTSRTQDSLGNYAFNYNIVDEKGASNSRSEAGDAHGNVKGYYSLNDIDGRSRHVDYIADDHGFRAVVKTNEQGTAKSAPAGAVIDSPYEGPVAPEAPKPEEPQVATPKPDAPSSNGHPTSPPKGHPAPPPKGHPAPPPKGHPAPIIVAPVAHPAPVFLGHPAPIFLAKPAHVLHHPGYFGFGLVRKDGIVNYKGHGLLLRPGL